MSGSTPLCQWAGMPESLLTKEENTLLQADLFRRICDELKKLVREQYKNYFRLMRFTQEKESNMLDAELARWIIRDILATDEYTLKGIAYYTDTFEDVVVEVLSGRNPNPSSFFLGRLIDLHRSVRRDLYNSILKKFIEQYLMQTQRQTA